MSCGVVRRGDGQSRCSTRSTLSLTASTASSALSFTFADAWSTLPSRRRSSLSVRLPAASLARPFRSSVLLAHRRSSRRVDRVVACRLPGAARGEKPRVTARRRRRDVPRPGDDCGTAGTGTSRRRWTTTPRGPASPRSAPRSPPCPRAWPRRAGSWPRRSGGSSSPTTPSSTRVLATSELVANAFAAGRPPIRIRVRSLADGQGDRRGDPRRRRRARRRRRRRTADGLHLTPAGRTVVESMAARWGIPPVGRRRHGVVRDRRRRRRPPATPTAGTAVARPLTPLRAVRRG